MRKRQQDLKFGRDSRRERFLFLFISLICIVAANECRSEEKNGDSVTMNEAIETADPYLWLEGVTDEKALDWVRQHNAQTVTELEADPVFEATRKKILTILNSNERIPGVRKYGSFYYNFWRDDQHIRGLWRRTTLEEYRKADPEWEAVLDLDQLAADENENWVWKGANVLYPDYDRCLIEISRGGADATVIREFDLNRKQFVDDGFTLPEAKSNVDWRNRDTLYVGTDFGEGSLTDSGYPRVVKEWTRGTPLSEAKLVFEGQAEDVSTSAWVMHDHGRVYEFVQRSVTFFTNELFIRRGDEWIEVEKPADAEVSTFGEHLLLRLCSEWTVAGKTYPSGALLAVDFEDYLNGDRQFSMLFEPTERKSLSDIGQTKNYLLLTELDHVRSRPYAVQFSCGEWIRTPIEVPAFWIGVGAGN